MSAEEAWTFAHARLRDRLAPSAVTIWLDDIEPVEIREEDNRLVLRCEARKAEWIARRYLPRIAEILRADTDLAGAVLTTEEQAA